MLLSLLLVATGASATTVQLVPVADAVLCESTGGTLANGAGDHLFAGRTNQATDAFRRALLRFDVSGIPAGAVIDSVSLEIEVTRTSDLGPRLLGLHAVTAPWSEGPSHPYGNEGSCDTAGPGDATWLHADNPGQAWVQPGGDFDPVAQSAVVTRGTWRTTFPNTTALAAQVQGWADDPATNHGWLVLGEESVVGSSRRFDSRTGASPPLLTIDFTPSPPLLTGPAPGDAGTDNVFSVRNGEPNADTVLLFSVQSGSTSVPGCPGVSVDLSGPGLLARDDTDGTGAVDFTVFVPAQAVGRTARFQAVQLSICSVSNLVQHTF